MMQFIAGGFLAYAIKAGFRRFAYGCTVIGACGLVLAFFSHGAAWVTVTRESLASALGRTLMFGIPSTFLIYGLVALELQGKAKSLFPNALVELGNWSYAFYLCHVLTISAAGRLTYRLLDSEQAWVNALLLQRGHRDFALRRTDISLLRGAYDPVPQRQTPTL